MRAWIFIFMASMLSTACLLTSCQMIKGKETITPEPVADIVDLPDIKPFQDLVKITTESGYSAQIPRSAIPLDQNGNMVYPVVDVQPSGVIKSASDTVSMFPGVGTMIGGTLSALLASGMLFQKKTLQAKIDRGVLAAAKADEAENLLIIDLSEAEHAIEKRENLLVKTAIGVEKATTDGAIKKKIKELMTKKERDDFDDITEEKRIEAVA